MDWKNVYHYAPTARQKQEGIVPVSQFGRMCPKLGIQIIGANSPQAKGRVERGHGTHQDRLIKKMRLQKIATYEAANRFLVDPYLPEHNAKYAVEPREKADFHHPVDALVDLDQVFCLEHERKVGHDWAVQYGSRWLQIEAQQKTPVSAGHTVVVRQHRDGSVTLRFQDKLLKWHEVAKRPSKPPVPLPKRRAVTRPKPAPEHPWRQPIVASQQR